MDRGGAQSLTRRSTVYLLQDVSLSSDSLREALNLKYEQEHDFEIRDVSIGLSRGLLYTGVIGRGHPPEWADAARRLTDVSPVVENKTAAGALLVPVDGQVFALTFGMGQLLLNQSRVTSGFGFGFALRVVKPDAVRQVTHSMEGYAKPSLSTRELARVSGPESDATHPARSCSPDHPHRTARSA